MTAGRVRSAAGAKANMRSFSRALSISSASSENDTVLAIRNPIFITALPIEKLEGSVTFDMGPENLESDLYLDATRRSNGHLEDSVDEADEENYDDDDDDDDDELIVDRDEGDSESD
uniref:Uncharacterized protein n=1 Tax=Biomphalaria glabrata TaxID=6526 RepID=A0A2C9KJK3_BIOGL